MAASVCTVHHITLKVTQTILFATAVAIGGDVVIVVVDGPRVSASYSEVPIVPVFSEILLVPDAHRVQKKPA